MTDTRCAGLKARMKRFARNECGTSTVEFVIMVPVFTGLLTLMADATALYLQQSNYWNMARDTARLVSRHAMTDAEAEAYLASRFGAGRLSETVSVVSGPTFVTVTVSADAREITPFGIVAFATGQRVAATVTASMEPI